MAQAKNKNTTALVLFAVVAGMIGLSFASVPLYRIFCQVTGYGGTTQVGEAPSGQAGERKITVRFDANTNQDLPWRFQPEQVEQTVKVGESKLAFYKASNRTESDTWGTATFNVTPLEAGAYFVKTDCFCFQEQKLEAGQVVDMPVSYYVDPEISDDPYLRDVDVITLSYTFFPIPEDEWPEIERDQLAQNSEQN